jgi:hypothetical protein
VTRTSLRAPPNKGILSRSKREADTMLKKAMLESEAGIIAVETNTIAVGGDEK